MNPTQLAMNPNRSLRRTAVPLLLALFAAAALATVRAADANPPARLTYQGFLVDANGTALANTAVQNYDVVFRIYTASQGGNIVWAEQQTVTVDKGNFAVLLGEGSAVGSEARPSLDAVFTGTDVSDRYIGITVLGLGGSNAEIAPRLRLLTSPYAFLAKNATALVSGTGQPLLSTVNGGFQTVGGNARGSGAVDLQTTRTDVAQVASGNNSVVAGGQNNKAANVNSAIGGGNGNTASGDNATVGGGLQNVASGLTVTIGGGFQNINSGTDSVIAGGHKNTNSAFAGSIGGGQFNLVNANVTTVGGGFKNLATAINATVGGGAENKSQGVTATISGGYLNLATGLESAIGGGSFNQALGDKSVVSGGLDNRSTGLQAAISGGHTNKAIGNNSAISGGYGNVASGNSSSIGGGDINQATGFQSRISGGLDNRATNDRSTVGGGHFNTSSGINSAIGGGYSNLANNNESTVGGGNINVASGLRSTVAGGLDNQATGIQASILGGHFNRATGVNATTLGGYNNLAQGDHSVAVGRRAKAVNPGTFVWADDQDSDFTSFENQTFIIRAAGGVGINKNWPTAPLHVASTETMAGGAVYQTVRLEAPNIGKFWDITIDNQASDPDLVFYQNSVEIGWIDPLGGGFKTPSDRRLKKDIEPIPAGVLDRIAKIPAVHFRMTAAPADAPLQLGVVAQDVQAVYPELVEDHGDRLAVSYDRLGVLGLAAIKELREEKNAEIKQLKEENAALKKYADQQIAELRSEMEMLKKVLAAAAAKRAGAPAE